jgi:sporulation protein YlmC with PRC-barrel domain
MTRLELARMLRCTICGRNISKVQTVELTIDTPDLTGLMVSKHHEGDELGTILTLQ